MKTTTKRTIITIASGVITVVAMNFAATHSLGNPLPFLILASMLVMGIFFD